MVRITPYASETPHKNQENPMLSRAIKKELEKSIKNFPVTVLLGARQVGKTTLAQSIYKAHKSSSIYLDLEIPSDLQKLRNDPFTYLQHFENQTVIIDEAQLLPELFPIIRALVDKKRKSGRFILLGSASKEILSSASESLAGRVHYLEMQPLLLSEVSAHNLYKHMIRGGFPEAYLSRNDEKAKAWFDGFTSSYIERDLPMLGLPANPITLRHLLMMLAGLNGQLVQYSSLANSLGISQPTVKRYIDFLEHAFILRRLLPYHTNISKRLTKTAKIYFRDSGLLHYFLNISDKESLLGSATTGAAWEGYALQQILPQLNYQTVPYFYRTHNGNELDLILVQARGVKLAIEIKFSSNPTLSKSNHSALEDLKNPDLLILTPEGTTYPLTKKTRIVNIKNLSKILNEYHVLQS